MAKNINLGIFANENIQRATLSLLSDLGIEMNVRSEQQIPIPAVVAAQLGQTPKAVQEICDKIQESYLAGVISDQTFINSDNAPTFSEACENVDKYGQMMVFAVDFKRDLRINRTEMATLTRALNRASKAAPVVLVCRYADEDGVRFAMSLCERTAYKQSGHTGEKAGKVNILRGINPENPHTGHIRIIEDMRLERNENTFEVVYKKWFGVFDNDVLTEHFYKELQNWFFWAVKHVHFPNDINDPTDDKKYNHQNVIRLITRLIFVWFLRQKGLVPKELFNREDLDRLVKDFEPDNFESNTYYRVILQNLFFATLNRKIEERAFISDEFIINRNKGEYNIKTFFRHASDLKVSKEEFINLLRPVPFMNNSLFECLDGKEQNGKIYNWDGFSDSNKPQRQSFVPNYLFFAKEEYVDLSKEYDKPSASSIKVFGLLTILKRYNFTVEENTPLDQDVALDPELLGKVFENLLAAYNPETEQTVRKSTGSYYTPRPIVQYMVDESLVAYLKKAVPSVDENIVRSLISYSDDDQVNTLTEKQTHDIVKAVLNCKVLDPACGSGAFPMGMLQQMSHLLSSVDASNKYWEEVVIERATNDESIVNKMNEEEKEALKKEIEEVFRLSVDYPDYARKLYLIENCIYGIDIQSIAVQISRLRFFISLVCEQQPSNDASKNYNIKPLPNLEMKFVCANTLVRLEHIDEARELFANKEILDLIAQLKTVRHEMFVVTDHHIKDKLKNKDNAFRDRIMLKTGDCYEKGIEDKIKELENAVVQREKDLEITKKEPDNMTQESIQYDLFGNVIATVSLKEKKINEINSDIRYFKREAKRLKETLLSGKDKAIQLAKQLTDWNPYDQNVSSPFFDPDWMFGISNGFDIVIANPPYVNIEGIDEKTKKNLFKNFKTCVGRTDLYIAFIEKALHLLSANAAVLVYIIPHPFITQSYAEPMRKMLIEDYGINRIVDTSNFSIFTSANVKNVILFVSNSKVSKTEIRIANSFDSFSSNIFDCREFPQIDFKQLKGYRFETKDFHQTLSLRNRISTGNIKLEEICVIAYGARLNHKTDKNKPKSYYISEIPSTDFKLFVEGKCIMRYHHTYAGFLNYQPTEHYNPMFKELFENEKIIFIRVVSDRIRFSYDNEHTYNSHTVINCTRLCDVANSSHPTAQNAVKSFGIELSCHYKVKYLLALLNSKLINWYFFQFLSDGINFYPGDARSLPIAKASDNIQNKVISLVDKILSKCENNLTFEQEDRDIDFLVYKLYGLTYDDVLVIDPETPIAREEYEKTEL